MLRFPKLPTIALLLASRLAYAAYSPPLTDVRITEDALFHTPSILYAEEQRRSARSELKLRLSGAQYVLQWDRARGYGFQIGASGGYVQAGGFYLPGAEVSAQGAFVGGQLRAYAMLWQSEGEGRPSALTAFVNLRGVYYSATENGLVDTKIEAYVFGGGIGLMAEWSLSDWFSLCPYAWLTPGFSLGTRVEGPSGTLDESAGFNLKRPVLAGIDVWLYPRPEDQRSHFSLSVLTSLFDVNAGNRSIFGVLGYTF